MPRRNSIPCISFVGAALMGTTSPQSAIKLLDRLRGEGFPGALLHGVERLETGGFDSDIDLVARGPMADALRRVESASEAVGLVPVLLWPYDVSSLTVLVVDPRGARVLPAVQVDLLVDPQGLGKYGVRTELLVREARSDGRFPSISELDRALYLWRKSHVKAQGARLHQAERELRAFSAREVRARVGEIFSWGPVPSADVVRAAHSIRLRRLLGRSERLLWRLMTPIACYLDGLPEETRKSLLEATEGVFPHVRERSSPVPFHWSLASRKPLLALSVRPAPGSAGCTSLALDAIVLRLHEAYRNTARSYLSSRLV